MDAARYARQGYVDVRQHGRDAGYIGLWETAEAAVERAARKHDHVDKETHVILEIEFTPHGIAHFTTMCQGVDGQFQSTLFKKTYLDVSQDWGTWHFWGDLPLHAVDHLGIPLISAQFFFGDSIIQ